MTKISVEKESKGFFSLDGPKKRIQTVSLHVFFWVSFLGGWGHFSRKISQYEQIEENSRYNISYEEI